MRIVLIALLLAGGVGAQPAFEAASLKPNKSGTMNSSSGTRRDNLEFKNVALRDILVDAFEIKDYQLVGPDWLASERFDLVAKAPPGTGDDEKLMPLLRTLLRERFQLQTHREKRDLPAFALVAAKGGFQLKPVERGGSSMSHNSSESGGRLEAKKVTLERFAQWLSYQVERPVLDETGIPGQFDFTLKYSKESAKGLSDSQEFPIVSLAIQEQLGLRLEKRTAPIDVVVVDHAEKVPTEN